MSQLKSYKLIGFTVIQKFLNIEIYLPIFEFENIRYIQNICDFSRKIECFKPFILDLEITPCKFSKVYKSEKELGLYLLKFISLNEENFVWEYNFLSKFIDDNLEYFFSNKITFFELLNISALSSNSMLKRYAESEMKKRNIFHKHNLITLNYIKEIDFLKVLVSIQLVKTNNNNLEFYFEETRSEFILLNYILIQSQVDILLGNENYKDIILNYKSINRDKIESEIKNENVQFPKSTKYVPKGNSNFMSLVKKIQENEANISN